MTYRETFDVKKQSIPATLVFDFLSQLSVGESIESPVVTATVYSGVDPNPSSLVATPPVEEFRPAISQQATGGISGVMYMITCEVVARDLEPPSTRPLYLQGYLTVV